MKVVVSIGFDKRHVIKQTSYLAKGSTASVRLPSYQTRSGGWKDDTYVECSPRSSEDPVGQLVETSRGLGRDDLTCGRLAGVEGDGKEDWRWSHCDSHTSEILEDGTRMDPDGSERTDQHASVTAMYARGRKYRPNFEKRVQPTMKFRTIATGVI
jgi:hypothetical protein